MLVAGRIRFLLPGGGRATVPPPAKHQQWALLLSLSEALLMLQDSSTVLLPLRDSSPFKGIVWLDNVPFVT